MSELRWAGLEQGEGRGGAPRVWRPRWASGEPFPLGRHGLRKQLAVPSAWGSVGRAGRAPVEPKLLWEGSWLSGTPSPLGVRSSPKRPLAGRGKVAAGAFVSETPPQVAQKWGAQAAAPLSLSRAASGQGHGLCSPFPKKDQLETWDELLRSC